MFITGIYTGRRISDLVALNVRDVACVDKRRRFVIRQRLKIREVKTGKFIDLILHCHVRRALSKYLRKRKQEAVSVGALLNEPLFRSQKPRRNGEHRLTPESGYRILHNAARRCGLGYEIGSHTMRKTFGYNLYNNGTNIELIQKIFNHSHPAITLSYIGVTQDDIDDAILSLE